MYIRTVEKAIETYLASKPKGVLFLWGPRRSGKTTLLTKLSKKLKVPMFNFDLLSDREKFVPRREILERIAKEHKVILIDEVQNYPESTVALKILIDMFPCHIIATGSSELRQKTSEFDSLAGRYEEAYCLPFSLFELQQNAKHAAHEQATFEQKILSEGVKFGFYPEIYTTQSFDAKIKSLEKLLDTFVLKDVISLYDLKNASLAKDILIKIALQIGQEVSLREIAGSLQANVSTVSNYIEVFVKNYILLPLPSFKTNIRKAVSENKKYYFYDLGIRNVLIRDFRPLDLRPDKGGVFENFIYAEIEKKRRNESLLMTPYFYREYGGKEVDLVLENYHKEYKCFEIKYQESHPKNIFPLPHSFHIIHKDNYMKVIEGVK